MNRRVVQREIMITEAAVRGAAIDVVTMTINEAREGVARFVAANGGASPSPLTVTITVRATQDADFPDNI